jgi:hypothetical protein
MKSNNLRNLAVGAAIMASPMIATNVNEAYAASDKVVIKAIMAKDATLDEKQIKEQLKGLNKQERASLEKDLGLVDNNKSDDKKGNGNGLNLNPTANLDSVLAFYAGSAKIADFDKSIKALKTQRDALYKSPVVDSLDRIITGFNTQKDKVRMDYSSAITALTKARDALAEATQKYLSGTSSKYRNYADGMTAFREVAKLLGFAVPADISGVFGPKDMPYVAQIQIKHNAKVDKIPGKETSVKIRGDADTKLSDYKTKMDTEIGTIDSRLTETQAAKEKAKKDAEVKNKEAFSKSHAEEATVKYNAANALYAQLQVEAKKDLRKDVMENVLTTAIGYLASIPQDFMTPKYAKRLEEMKRWQADIEGSLKEIKGGLADMISDAANKFKPGDYNEKSTQRYLNTGSVAPFISVSDRVNYMKEDTKIKANGANAEHEELSNEVALALRAGKTNGKIAFVGDASLTNEGASAQVNGQDLGDRTSNIIKVKGGVEGNADFIKGLQIAYKGLIGLENYNEVAKLKLQPGIDQEFNSKSLLGSFKLGGKYVDSKKFRAGVEFGYNFASQLSEMLKIGVAPGQEGEATDRFNEFFGSINGELSLGNMINVIGDLEGGVRNYNFLENYVKGTEGGFGGSLAISADKFAFGGRGFTYPGSGYVGTLFARVAPFEKVPVSFNAQYDMDKIFNSESDAVTKNVRDYSWMLGITYGGTIKDLVDQVKQIRPKIKDK